MIDYSPRHPGGSERRRAGFRAASRSGEARDTLHIEARFPRETIEELARRGHRLDRWGDWNELARHAHGITIASAERPWRRRL